TALRVAPASQAQAAIELVSTGLEQAGTDPTKYPLSLALQRSSPEGAPPSAQFEGWLAALERRPVRAPESVVQSTPQVPPPPAPPAPPPARGPRPRPPRSSRRPPGPRSGSVARARRPADLAPDACESGQYGDSIDGGQAGERRLPGAGALSERRVAGKLSGPD